MENSTQKRIVVVGGGFGGVQTALSLVRRKNRNLKITLISDKSHFEYTPSLYRVVVGASPLEVCIPLLEIFKDMFVEIIHDTVVCVDNKRKMVVGVSGETYLFDVCILALGSEVTYFDLPGLKEFSFGFKSIHHALRLKRHLHEIFEVCKQGTSEDKVCACHVIIVGGGATGVELAGELSFYLRMLAKKHGFPPTFVTLDLIEASPRILPMVPDDISENVMHRLRSLGVNVFLNRSLVKEEIERVYLKDMEMKTKTVIWAAGIKVNHLYGTLEGVRYDKKGRVLVDEYLRVEGQEDLYVIGDGASTPYSGMAQEAIRNGECVARNIVGCLGGKSFKKYHPFPPSHVIPIGRGWAAALLVGQWRLYGKLGWWLRCVVDFKYFLSILPLQKAWRVFQEGTSLCESCETCSTEILKIKN